jgi:asparagine synthase (glutamine-hydrolysing)
MRSRPLCVRENRKYGVLEGVFSAFELEREGRHPPPCASVNPVAAVWREPWGLRGLDEAPHGWSEPEGGSWLAWSGRAWWRDAEARSAGMVSARRLLAALLEQGPPALCRIDGSSAIAWYDARAHRLWLARDYFGIEPLHYVVVGTRAFFASRLTRLFPSLENRPSISAEGLRDYLAYGFCPGERTIMEGIMRVPPGVAVGLSVGDGGRIATEESRWHRLSYREQTLTGDEAIAQAFRAELEASVRRRLGGGRPAVMLSGGMDSSAVASLMRRFEPGEIRTFTFRCNGKSFDESAFARRLSTELGMKHTQLDLTENEAIAFSEGVGAMDCPFSDAGIEIGTWLVGRAAAGDADYVLVGDGGDELWASHPIYAAQRLMRWYEAVPIGRVPRRWLRRLLAALPDSPRKRDVFVIAKRLLPDPELPAALRHIRWKVYHDARSLGALLDGIELPVEPAEIFYGAALEAFEGFDGRPGSPDAMLYNDYRTATAFYAARLLLLRPFGLEARIPFLDADLVDLGARIPFHKKLEGLQRTKRLFREAMRGVMPEAILNRGDKLGHSVPMKNWLRSRGPLAREVSGVLIEELAARRGLVRREAVEDMLAEHTSSRHNHSHRLWALYVLELWLQKQLDAAVPVDVGGSLRMGETA